MIFSMIFQQGCKVPLHFLALSILPAFIASVIRMLKMLKKFKYIDQRLQQLKMHQVIIISITYGMSWAFTIGGLQTKGEQKQDIPSTYQNDKNLMLGQASYEKDESLSILLISIGAFFKVFSSTISKRFQLMQGYRDRYIYSKTINKRVPIDRRDFNREGKLEKVLIKADSTIFKQALIVQHEAKLLLAIEDQVKNNLAREGLNVKFNERERLEYLENVKLNHYQKMIQRKQDMMNQSYGQKRKKQVNEKRVKQNMKDHNISIKQMMVRKEIKKEITSLIEKDIIMTEQESQVDSDLSYNEFNNLLREDPSRHLFIADAKVKQSQRNGIFNIYEPKNIYKVIFNEKAGCLIGLMILIIKFMIKPNSQYNMIMNSRHKESFFQANIYTYLTTSILSLIFVDMRPELSVLDLFGLFLSLGGFYLYYLGSDLLFEDVDAQSAIHSIKHAFQFKNPREFQEVELKLQQIYSILGLQGLYRVLFDTALAQNKRQLWHTSDPVLQLREQFDVYFESRRNLWGGSYPRPSVEMIEKQWKLNLHQLQRGVCGVRIELDPDMDYSTYQNALQKWEIIKQWKEEEKDAEEKELIRRKFEDILDLDAFQEESPDIRSPLEQSQNLEERKSPRPPKSKNIESLQNSRQLKSHGSLEALRSPKTQKTLKKPKKSGKSQVQRQKSPNRGGQEATQLSDIDRQRLNDLQKKMDQTLRSTVNDQSNMFVDFKNIQKHQDKQQVSYNPKFKRFQKEEEEKNDDFEELDFKKIRD
eukprot:403343731